MKTISVLSYGGGTGKTAITANLGACLVKEGYNVLLIDLSPQCDLSASFDIESNYSVFDLMKGDLENFRVKIKEGIHILNGSESLHREICSIEWLKSKLEIFRNFKLNERYLDYILIDCPINPILPSKFETEELHNLNGYALYASDYVLCPIIPSINSIKSITDLWEDIQIFKTKYHSKLKILGFFLNRVQKQRKMHKHWNQIFENQLLADLFLNTSISESVYIDYATEKSESVLSAFPDSKPSIDFQVLAKELISRLSKMV